VPVCNKKKEEYVYKLLYLALIKPETSQLGNHQHVKVVTANYISMYMHVVGKPYYCSITIVGSLA